MTVNFNIAEFCKEWNRFKLDVCKTEIDKCYELASKSKQFNPILYWKNVTKDSRFIGDVLVWHTEP